MGLQSARQILLVRSGSYRSNFRPEAARACTGIGSEIVRIASSSISKNLLINIS